MRETIYFQKYLKMTKKIYKTAHNIDMWDEHICIENIKPSQNTAFLWIPTLYERILLLMITFLNLF